MSSNGRAGEAKIPLLDYASTKEIIQGGRKDEDEIKIQDKVWIESKKLWRVAGPAIFSRIASFSMFVITQAFAGHLGDLELAAISISTNVILGFDVGLMVISSYNSVVMIL